MESDLVLRPCHSYPDVVAPPLVQPVTDVLSVAQEGTGTRLEVSTPADTPPPGVAEPPCGPDPPEGEEHTTARSFGSPPHPPSLTMRPVRPGDQTPSSLAPSPPPPTPLLHEVGESSPTLLPGDPLGAQAYLGVPSTASSDATAPINPTDTATSSDQVDPEAAGPTFLLAAAPTLFLAPATPPDHSHTAAIAACISCFGRGEWDELLSDALGRCTPLPWRTGHRSRTATDPSTADERRIVRCLRLAACNETSRACAALESAEAAPHTQGTIQRLRSKHPDAERPTLAWLSGFQGSALVLSVDHLCRAIFTAPRGSTGVPFGSPTERSLPPSLLALLRFCLPRFPFCRSEPPSRGACFRGRACPSHLSLTPCPFDFPSGRRCRSVAPVGAYADPLRIPEAQWQVASSSRLGLPIPQLALVGQCSCGQAIDDMTVPHHAVWCLRFGVATTIHDTVKFMLRDFAVEAGFTGQPVVGEGTQAGGLLEQRGEAGQPGSGGQWGQHQLRGRVVRGAGGQRGQQGGQTGQDGEGGQQRQQQESQRRPRAQGAAPPGLGSGMGQGREQQRADRGTGGAAGSGGEDQGVKEAAGDRAGGLGELGEGRGQVG
ncbi:unnamed protein product [Closterium sp. NIES-54]